MLGFRKNSEMNDNAASLRSEVSKEIAVDGDRGNKLQFKRLSKLPAPVHTAGKMRQPLKAVTKQSLQFQGADQECIPYNEPVTEVPVCLTENCAKPKHKENSKPTALVKAEVQHG